MGLSQLSDVYTLLIIFSAFFFILGISICIYRKKSQKHKQPVKIYREERELVAFTNKAFESFSMDTRVSLNRESFQVNAKKPHSIRGTNRGRKPTSTVSSKDFEST